MVRFVNTPVPSNAYLLIDDTRKSCVAIDPGSKEQRDMRDFIISHDYSLDYVFLTHEHFDHCWGVNSLLDAFNVKVVSTRLCAEWVGIPMNYFNKLYYDSDELFSIDKVDICVEDFDWKLEWGAVDIVFLDAKGHTSRSMCVNVGNALFSGDTLIYNTKPFLKKKYGASKEDLKKTIDNIYEMFNPNTIVYPGHGEVFRLADMKEFYKDYFRI